MSAPVFNRAEEKAPARDEERLRGGEISPQELQRENFIFGGFRNDVICFGPKDRPKFARYLNIRPRD